jgi:hypothetical protein
MQAELFRARLVHSLNEQTTRHGEYSRTAPAVAACGSCEEDFLLELGWVLMITNSHHKRRKLMEVQDEKTR